ncbi:MAG: 50S ribosomal protein L21, partial [Solirubrobacteraceae bacterium]
MSTYAIVKTGGKQYRVEQGQKLLVERLPVGDGESVALQPLLFVDGSDVVDGEGLSGVSVTARVVAHERGPKLRIVKFKPKRGSNALLARATAYIVVAPETLDSAFR